MEEFDGSEIWEDELRRKELNKPGAMLFNRVEREQKVTLKDSTGFEDLQAQFDSADNRGRTVRQQVSDYNGLGSGRIVIKGKTNTPAGIFFYPDDPDFDKKAVESIEGWGRVFNAPVEFAPLLAVGVGGAKLLRQKGLNKAKMTFMKVDEDLNIADSFNVTSMVDSALVKRSINFPKTQSTIKPGFVTDASGQLVSPGYDTGYRSFLQRGRNPTHYNIASQAKNMFNGGSVKDGGISDLVPKVHNVTGLTAKRNLQTQLGKWLRANEADIHAGVVKPSDFGKIIYNNQAQRLSSEGWKNFLATGEDDYSKLEFRKIGTEDKRELQADPGGIDPLNQNLTRMNQAFIDSKGEVGLNPEHLSPQIFRKGITYSARKVREFNKIIRKELGLDIQQEHSLGLAQAGTDDAMGFFLGSGKQNLALNQLSDPDAFTAASAAELGIPGKGNVEAAEALKGQTTRHEIRRQEYLQQGWLESLSNWGIKAKEIGGNPFEAYNKILLQRKKDLLSGKEIELRMPGSNVTMTDMIRIQQLGFKMDRVQAAQTIMAERAIVDAAIAAGVTDTPKGLALLEKYIKYIDVKVEVQRAAKAGRPFKEYPFEEVHPSRYTKTVLPSAATGRLGTKPTSPLPQSELQKLKSKLDTK